MPSHFPIVTTFPDVIAPPSLGMNYYQSGIDAMMIDHSDILWVLVSFGANNDYFYLIDNNGYVKRVIDFNIWRYMFYPYPIYGFAISLDSKNNIYFSNNSVIYRYKTNSLPEIFVGSGNAGAKDGNGIFCSFNTPTAMAIDKTDNIYIWDSGLIRKINQNKDVITIAGKSGNGSTWDGVGTNAAFAKVYGMCFDDADNLILACGNCIRKMTPMTAVTTIAGSFTKSGYADGPGSSALFGSANRVYVSQNMIYVSDQNRIRKISYNPTPQAVSGSDLSLSMYPGIRITGIPGRTYQIQSSTDTSTWKAETTLLLTSSPYLWFDQNALGAKIFYRAYLIP